MTSNQVDDNLQGTVIMLEPPDPSLLDSIMHNPNPNQFVFSNVPPPSDDSRKPLQLPKGIRCKLCEITLTDEKRYRNHVKSKKHKKAVLRSKLGSEQAYVQLDTLEEATTPDIGSFGRVMAMASPMMPQKTILSELSLDKPVKEKYALQHWVERPEQNKLFVTTLAAFLALRYSLNSQVKTMRISGNNKAWDLFGDIVIEFSTENNEPQVHAIQCKQVLSGKKLTPKLLVAREGRFSIETQYKAISKVKKCSYSNTSFIFLTASDLKIHHDNQMLELPGYLRDLLKSGGRNSQVAKKPEKLDEIEAGNVLRVRVHRCRQEEMANTTDEHDNIFKFSIAEDNTSNFEFPKLSYFVNQKKTKSVRRLIDTMLEDKFDEMPDISHDLVKYLSQCYKERQTYNYKLTKEDVLLKIAELFLSQFVTLPEVSLQNESVELWDCVTRSCDLTIANNNEDILNKIYSSIGGTLKLMFDDAVDISEKFVKLQKCNVQNAAFASQLFDGWHTKDFQSVSLKRLYVLLWKLGFAPLVLVADSECDQQRILNVITFLKSMKISRNFILLTSELKVNIDHFRFSLNIFARMADIRRFNEGLLCAILERVRMEIFTLSVSLNEITAYNRYFLEKTTPDTLLNIILGQCFYGNIADTSYSDNTYEDVLILGEDYIKRIEDQIEFPEKKFVVQPKTCCLTCQVARGKPKLEEVHAQQYGFIL